MLTQSIVVATQGGGEQPDQFFERLEAARRRTNAGCARPLLGPGVVWARLQRGLCVSYCQTQYRTTGEAAAVGDWIQVSRSVLLVGSDAATIWHPQDACSELRVTT